MFTYAAGIAKHTKKHQKYHKLKKNTHTEQDNIYAIKEK